MTDFQGISILVIVLLHCVFSISAALHDEQVSEYVADGRTVISSKAVSNELNEIIIDKVLTILELDALARKRISQMKKPCNKKSKVKSKKAQTEIYLLQFFDRNQTSVTIDSQPFKIGNVPLAPPKIDIGKLNWTDASFDKNLKAIDFSKITAEEFKKILDETMKNSNCPQGSFYNDANKGCISFDNFGSVPQSSNSIDIDALFNKPLNGISSENEKLSEKLQAKIEFGNSINLIELLHKLNSTKLSPDQLRMVLKFMESSSSKSNASKVIESTSNLSPEQFKQVSMVIENYLPKSSNDNAQLMKTLQSIGGHIDEGEIPNILGHITGNILQPASSSALINGDNMMLNLKISNESLNPQVGVKMEINPEMTGRIKFNFTDDSLLVHPKTIEETVPIKMMMKIPGKFLTSHETVDKLQPININFPLEFLRQAGQKTSIDANATNLGSMKSNVGSAIFSFGNVGNVVGDNLAAHFGHSFEVKDDKLSQKNEATTERYNPPKKRVKQAYFVHEVPLISRKAAENEKKAEAITKATPTEAQTTTESPKAIGLPKLIPTLVQSGKDIVETKKKILSNFFPRLYTGRRFATPDSKENINEIRKNVPRPKIEYRTVEGKTMSDSSDEVTAEVSQELQLTTQKTPPAVQTNLLPVITTPGQVEEEILASDSPSNEETSTKLTETN